MNTNLFTPLVSAALALAALTPLALHAAITQQAYLKASTTDPDPDHFNEFGVSLALSGDTLVVGAPGESSSATGVNGDQNDISAPGAGAAYVFVRNGTTWKQQAYLKASNADGPAPGEYNGDLFGREVAISGDTIVVGAYSEDSNATGVNGDQSDNSASYAGAAYVFVRNGTNWSQQAYLKPSNTQAGDLFGQKVAVSGDTVAVVGGGVTTVFVRDGTNWFQQANLLASGAVAISGDTLVAGGGNETAYVFMRTGTNWTLQAPLKASNSEVDDGFGWSVGISGDTLVIGTPQEASSATGVNGNQSGNGAPGSGAAYVFVRNGTNWTQQAYLKTSNTEAGDFFGSSVAISGNTVVVGASEEDSSARGVNGNQSNNSASGSGATYVFVRNGTNWTQQAYLKASNSEAGDLFGFAVSVSGNTAVVGAYMEASNATGVNGNQNNNSVAYAGAAYVFTGLGFGPQLAIERDGSAGYFLRFTGAPEITYRLQRAPSVTGPWSDIATKTAPASGLIEYHETAPPPGAAYYRTAQP